MCGMLVLFFALAALLTIVIPAVAAAAVFYVAFPWWIERVLKSDPSVHERLQLDVSEGRVAWEVASSELVLQHRPQPQPYPPLAYAALVGLAATASQTAVFASGSRVPVLWWVSGAIASAIVLSMPFVTAWLLRSPLRRLTNRALGRHANNKFLFAAQTIADTREIARQIDQAYASIGLQARTNAIALCREALVEHAWVGRDSAMARLIGIKIEADYDLRRLQYLARLLTNAWSALAQAKSDLNVSDGLKEAMAQIERRIRSRDLADALQNARWADAHELLKMIGADLDRVLEVGIRDAAMPVSVEDAYRLLKVTEETPLENIKAVVNAYRWVWHPDLARDEIEHERCTLRMQQINIAWGFIQKARADRPT